MTDSDLQKFSKIIIPLDGSKESERALKYGVSLAVAYKAEIVIVSVAPKGKKSEGPIRTRLEEISPELIKQLKDMPASILMETYHEIMLGTIKKRDIAARSVMKEGNISKKSVLTMLLELIKEEKADLVILASHRRSGFQKLTEGSLTEDLVKISSVPVLVVTK
ncbi:MAG: universal stress protein [Methanosarcinales archaeon]|nr:universal stress protein [Methanosarcinales archaeon]